MYIIKIEWIDKDEKEAILKVVNNMESLICFSCPCSYNLGDVLTEPLECLDTDDIEVCNSKKNRIEKMEGTFKYKLIGKLKDVKNGIIEVCGFEIHIDEDKIPGDAKNEMNIQVLTSRIDVW